MKEFGVLPQIARIYMYIVTGTDSTNTLQDFPAPSFIDSNIERILCFPLKNYQVNIVESFFHEIAVLIDAISFIYIFATLRLRFSRV